MTGRRRWGTAGRASFLCAALVLFSAARTDGQQTGVLRRVLEVAGLDPTAETAIRSGDVVAALVPELRADEVGLLGVGRLAASADTFLARFGDLDAYRRNGVTQAVGGVSSPPTTGDFETVPIPPSDLAALPGCEVGSCIMKLPAGALRDVAGADTGQVAAAVRKALGAAAEEYLRGGLAGLPLDADKSDPVSAADAMGSLLFGPLPVLALFPDLQADLADLEHPLPDARLFWISESFGMREMLGLNALIARRYSLPETPAVVLTERVYSSHYFVGGYVLTALIVDTPAGGGDGATYLVYSARYRLDTSLNALERRVLEGHLHRYVEALIQAEQTALGSL